jgi:hypothetical protein
LWGIIKANESSSERKAAVRGLSGIVSFCSTAKRAYHIRNICNTRRFLFDRMDGANDTVEIANTAAALRQSVSSISAMNS